MTPEPYYLWRYTRGKPVELVAIVVDEDMAWWWLWAHTAERRRWTRFLL